MVKPYTALRIFNEVGDFKDNHIFFVGILSFITLGKTRLTNPDDNEPRASFF